MPNDLVSLDIGHNFYDSQLHKTSTASVFHRQTVLEITEECLAIRAFALDLHTNSSYVNTKCGLKQLTPNKLQRDSDRPYIHIYTAI